MQRVRKGARDEVSRIELVTWCERKRKEMRERETKGKKRRKEGEKEIERDDQLSWTERVTE